MSLIHIYVFIFQTLRIILKVIRQVLVYASILGLSVAVVKSGKTQLGDTATDRLLSAKVTVITVSFELLLEKSRQRRTENGKNLFKVTWKSQVIVLMPDTM